ncbi:TSUP family transporter [Thalassolituus sp. LLYu03]|uniref:TSUP family transporter n=1 Tax=Thalassolituus sp. LLYu03 TaxID=3421656 RepID=UPI003D2B5949
MPEFSPEVLLLLTLVAMLAGFIDAIAGGGGLLTIPALLFAGLSPVQALATNKLQASFGSFSATRFFVREGLVSPGQQRWSIAATAVGAALGALAIQQLNSDWLLKVMPFALIAIALYLLLARNVGRQAEAARLTASQMNGSLLPSVGFYDGFFGPGTGTFFTLGFCQLRGMTMVQATAHAKLMNFTTNLVSLLVFVFSGQILWLTGLCMAAGQALGARLGAGTALKQGAGFIRLMTVAVCIAISLSLFWRQMSAS